MNSNNIKEAGIPASNTQILSLYEQEDLSPEEIAEGLGYEVEAVKTVLIQSSPLFRRRTIKPSSYSDSEDAQNEVISKEEFRQVTTAYKQLAIFSSVDAVRERSGRFLINEYLGRNKTFAAIEKGKTLNITLINAHIEQSKKQALAILEKEPPENKETLSFSPKLIDV